MEWILNGGEDYVLLAAIRSEEFAKVKLAVTEAGADLIEIGRFVSGSEMKLIKKSGMVFDIVPKGWDHFRT
jgi:thiamine monophosphate kinase